MKVYLAVTTALFGLLTIVHLWRAVVEPTSLDPWFIAITVVAALLCLWSGRLFIAARARSRQSPS